MASSKDLPLQRKESYTRIDGVIQIYHPEKRWGDHPIAGLSKSHPFYLILGEEGEYRSYCDLIEWYKVAGNPLSTSLVAKDGLFYSYRTAIAEGQKIGDIPVALGRIRTEDRVPVATRYDEILYLACNNNLISLWTPDLLKLDMFYGLRSNPEYKIRTYYKSEGNACNWELWVSVVEDQKVIADWCEYRLRILYGISPYNSKKYPQEVVFEIRAYDPGFADPLKSTIYSTYKFSAKSVSETESFPVSSLYGEKRAEQVLVTDYRGLAGESVSYLLYRDNDIPFSANSPIVTRASATHTNQKQRANKALLVFLGIAATAILLVEYHRRKTKNKHNEN